MALQIPTTKEVVDIFIDNFEAAFGQTIPIQAKAFLRVLAATEGMSFTQLYKYGIERALQNFALTATGSDLDEIGNEYGVTRKEGTYARFNVDVNTPGGASIVTYAEGLDLIGDSNGKDYEVEEELTTSLLINTLKIIARETGTESNLVVGDTLTFVNPPVGSESVATVSSITEDAIDDEDDEEYRRRVLNEIRTVGGGGNYADYRRWAEQATRVYRAFPYSGKPNAWKVVNLIGGTFQASTKYIFLPTGTSNRDLGLLDTGLYPPGGEGHFIRVENSALNDGVYRIVGVLGILNRLEVQEPLVDEVMSSPGSDITNISLPGDRTVFIECLAEFETDGIPTQEILDEARESINTNPVTGLTRPPLGETDQHLFVQPITRREVYVQISGLSVDSTKEAQAKSAVQTAVSEHLRSLTPYIEGLDSEIDRNDRISSMTVSQVVSDTLKAYGGFAEDVKTGLEVGVFISSYQLTQGELAKLGSITYV